jgi:cyclophilin family peptidyl-prolyl cis-trans isomerase
MTPHSLRYLIFALCNGKVSLPSLLGSHPPRNGNTRLERTRPMSSYTTHPAATASAIIHIPPYGDIEVELFATQCPLAVRNFITLGMEGYFTNTPILRIVPEFIVQMGATNIQAGECIYDEDTFPDEFHSRLRYTGRGMLAMANSGPNTNKSQFFFTLRQTEELQGINTLFGKVRHIIASKTITEKTASN